MSFLVSFLRAWVTVFVTWFCPPDPAQMDSGSMILDIWEFWKIGASLSAPIFLHTGSGHFIWTNFGPNQYLTFDDVKSIPPTPPSCWILSSWLWLNGHRSEFIKRGVRGKSKFKIWSWKIYQKFIFKKLLVRFITKVSTREFFKMVFLRSRSCWSKSTGHEMSK